METSAYTPYATSGTPVMPMPPRLHWGWVLLLSVLTRSLLADIWLLVQAVWIRKITGRTDVQTWAIVNVCKVPVGLLIGVIAGASYVHGDGTLQQAKLTFAGLEVMFGIAVLVVYLTTIFKMRAALEDEPIGIPLGGGMTFFFGPLYFQYFLRDWMPMSYSPATPYPQYTHPSVPPQA